MNLKKNIEIPKNVQFEFVDNLCTFVGPKGKISHELHNFLELSFIDNFIYLSGNENLFRKRDIILLRSIFNTTYVNLKNCIFGVLNLFEYYLVLRGVGYKVTYDTKLSILTFLLGYSHPVNITIPEDIIIELPSNSEIIVKSVSKFKAGQFAANIKSIKLPEIYKGNGIRYKDETIILKVPKKTK